MIEVTNNKVKCNIKEEEKMPRDQLEKYKEVIAAFNYANSLFTEYKNEFGIDKQSAEKLLYVLNGGRK